MHDAVLVRIAERGEELLHDAHHRPKRNARAAVKAARELLALHEIHDDVWRALVLAVIEDGDDVRMRKLAGRMRFALEPRAHLGKLLGRKNFGAQHLQRHAPLDHRVERLVDDAHRAAADLAAQFILADIAERAHPPSRS